MRRSHPFDLLSLAQSTRKYRRKLTFRHLDRPKSDRQKSNRKESTSHTPSPSPSSSTNLSTHSSIPSDEQPSVPSDEQPNPSEQRTRSQRSPNSRTIIDRPPTSSSHLSTPNSPPSYHSLETLLPSSEDSLRPDSTRPESPGQAQRSQYLPTYEQVYSRQGPKGRHEFPSVSTDVLPPYSCSVQHGALVRVKMERIRLRVPRYRPWTRVYCEIEGTRLSLYYSYTADPPQWGQSMPSTGSWLDRRRWKTLLRRRYSLQLAACGLAQGYEKNPHVIRIRVGADQFLLDTFSADNCINWLHALSAAIAISSPIEERTDSISYSLPRVYRLWMATLEDRAPSNELVRQILEYYIHILGLPTEPTDATSLALDTGSSAATPTNDNDGDRTLDTGLATEVDAIRLAAMGIDNETRGADETSDVDETRGVGETSDVDELPVGTSISDAALTNIALLSALSWSQPTSMPQSLTPSSPPSQFVAEGTSLQNLLDWSLSRASRPMYTLVITLRGPATERTENHRVEGSRVEGNRVEDVSADVSSIQDRDEHLPGQEERDEQDGRIRDTLVVKDAQDARYRETNSTEPEGHSGKNDSPTRVRTFDKSRRSTSGGASYRSTQRSTSGRSTQRSTSGRSTQSRRRSLRDGSCLLLNPLYRADIDEQTHTGAETPSQTRCDGQGDDQNFCHGEHILDTLDALDAVDALDGLDGLDRDDSHKTRTTLGRKQSSDSLRARLSARPHSYHGLSYHGLSYHGLSVDSGRLGLGLGHVGRPDPFHETLGHRHANANPSSTSSPSYPSPSTIFSSTPQTSPRSLSTRPHSISWPLPEALHEILPLRDPGQDSRKPRRAIQSESQLPQSHPQSRVSEDGKSSEEQAEKSSKEPSAKAFQDGTERGHINTAGSLPTSEITPELLDTRESPTPLDSAPPSPPERHERTGESVDEFIDRAFREMRQEARQRRRQHRRQDRACRDPEHHRQEHHEHRHHEPCENQAPTSSAGPSRPMAPRPLERYSVPPIALADFLYHDERETDTLSPSDSHPDSPFHSPSHSRSNESPVESPAATRPSTRDTATSDSRLTTHSSPSWYRKGLHDGDDLTAELPRQRQRQRCRQERRERAAADVAYAQSCFPMLPAVSRKAYDAIVYRGTRHVVNWQRGEWYPELRFETDLGGSAEEF